MFRCRQDARSEPTTHTFLEATAKRPEALRNPVRGSRFQAVSGPHQSGHDSGPRLHETTGGHSRATRAPIQGEPSSTSPRDQQAAPARYETRRLVRLVWRGRGALEPQPWQSGKMRNRPHGRRRDRAEDARRVEVRAAVPMDRPVGAHSATVCRSPIRPCSAMLRWTRTALLDQHGRRASSASVLSAFWHKYELSPRRRALQQLVRSADFGEWQALGHDRVDLAAAK
jgi:hypothetical protein